MTTSSESDDRSVATESIGLNGEFQLLDPRKVTVDRIATLIVAAVAAFATVVGLLIFAIFGGGIGTIWLIVAGACILIILLLLGVAKVWPPLEYRHAKWRLDKDGLQIRRGVVWRHQLSVPLARVQHANLSQGPLQRRFDLSTLTVYTAGTVNASVELAGLANATASKLRDKLVCQRKAADVV